MAKKPIKHTIEERLSERVDERVKLLLHITRQERLTGKTSDRGEWLLVFECLQYLFRKVKR